MLNSPLLIVSCSLTLPFTSFPSITHTDNLQGLLFLVLQVHFKDGRLLLEEEHEYLCNITSLKKEYPLEIEDKLIKSSDYFMEQVKRYFWTFQIILPQSLVKSHGQGSL